MSETPSLVGPVRPADADADTGTDIEADTGIDIEADTGIDTDTDAVTDLRRAARAIRDAVRRHGYAVCHGRSADWARAAAPPLADLLGADLSRWHAAREPAARDRLVGSRLLLRWAVAAAGGCAPDEVRLGRDARGRPVVCAPAGLDAGLSHTGDLLVVGVARGRLIGVDVEARGRSLRDLAERICHPRESAELRRLPPAERETALVRLWTLKEAWTKALGVGLAQDLTRLDTRSPARSGGRDGWRLDCREIRGGFLVGVAVGPGGGTDSGSVGDSVSGSVGGSVGGSVSGSVGGPGSA
ncbi:4'-phosphopantetheinyl transferase family protein [Streptomyces sp. NPDC001595]|uniref:4'-phosphopantetheinyl transferase family protein n=1 Tax=Streptomyces sp. NPDC001532 TaxID=3154520 RepID=UPI003318B745